MGSFQVELQQRMERTQSYLGTVVSDFERTELRQEIGNQEDIRAVR
jgi:hypothetical protein